jgi:hypothetical protein
METVAQRVDRLEQVMIELAEQSKITQREVARLSIEMRAFKDEMNKRWGDLANKMGTLAEDIVAPNISGIAREYFGCKDLDFFGVRIRKRNTKDASKVREFDVIAVCDDKVIINETKSNPKIEYINEFINVLKEIYDYFPEYRGKKIIPIFSSLYIPEDLVTYLTKNRIYAMAMKDDTMDLLNFEQVVDDVKKSIE